MLCGIHYGTCVNMVDIQGGGLESHLEIGIGTRKVLEVLFNYDLVDLV